MKTEKRRTLRRMKIRRVSLVDRPANEHAQVVLFKAEKAKEDAMFISGDGPAARELRTKVAALKAEDPRLTSADALQKAFDEPGLYTRYARETSGRGRAKSALSPLERAEREAELREELEQLNGGAPVPVTRDQVAELLDYVQKQADSLVAKSGNKLSRESAVSRLFSERPSLAREYALAVGREAGPVLRDEPSQAVVKSGGPATSEAMARAKRLRREAHEIGDRLSEAEALDQVFTADKGLFDRYREESTVGAGALEVEA